MAAERERIKEHMAMQGEGTSAGVRGRGFEDIVVKKRRREEEIDKARYEGSS